MERYANTCELSARLDVTARYHAVVVYQQDDKSHAEVNARRLKRDEFSVYFDEIDSGYPGCEGKIYDITKHLWWKQTDYLIVLWSKRVREVENDKTIAFYDLLDERNDLFYIYVKLRSEIEPPMAGYDLDVAARGIEWAAEALAIELEMPPAGSSAERIKQFRELIVQRRVTDERSMKKGQKLLH
jgi:hypothetical protein